MTDIRIVYVTAATLDEARRLGRAAVEERLAACANILPGMRAIYRWEDAMQDEGEVVLLLKTRAGLVETLTARLVELHEYDCPCVLVLPVEGGNPGYLDWLRAETRADIG